MVPAGPFAMGPLAAGNTGMPRPSAFRSSQQGFGRSIGGSGAVKAAHGVTSLPRNRDHLADDDEPEVYSEEESGLTIVDLEDVKLLDSMAPDALRKEKPKVKRKVKVKAEAPDGDVDMLAVKGERIVCLSQRSALKITRTSR
jgi:DNA-directed RNA polymerase III subunit RPC4